MNAVYKKKISEFLQLKSIAVLGYSTNDTLPANSIYKKLNNNGFKVFAVNPKADKIKDVDCYPDVKSIPEPVEGAVLCTPKTATEQAVKECAENGISHIWMHKGLGIGGSYDAQAFQTAKELGVEVIPGGCPMMFVKPDIFHRCFGWLQKLPE
jgi:predicted CoA-binding protein